LRVKYREATDWFNELVAEPIGEWQFE